MTFNSIRIDHPFKTEAAENGHTKKTVLPNLKKREEKRAKARGEARIMEGWD